MSESSRVYVGGLLDSVRKEDLETEFSKYGKLNHVWLASNPPGFAFIEFDNQEDAEEAIKALNDQDVCGSRIRVELSRGRRRGGGSRRGGRGGHYSDRGGRGSFRGRGGRDMHGGGRGGMRDRGRSSFGSGGYSRGGRSGRDRYDDDGGRNYSSYSDMPRRDGNRDRFYMRDQYDNGNNSYSRSMPSGYRSRSPFADRGEFTD